MFCAVRLPELLAREAPEPADAYDEAWDACKRRLTGIVLAEVADTRADVNTGAHTALAIDVDALPCPRKAFLARCAAFRCVVYESASSRERGNGDRLRVIAALAAPLAPERVRAARRAFARALELDPAACGASKADAISQVMFVGRIGGTRARKMWVYDGAVWAPGELEADAPLEFGDADAEPCEPVHSPEIIPAVPKRLALAVEPVAGGQRYGGRALNRGLAGMMARKGYALEAVEAFVRALPSSQPDRRASEAREAAEQWYAGDTRTAGAEAVHSHFLDAFGPEEGERIGRRVVRAVDKALRRAEQGEPEGWIGPWTDADAKWWPAVLERWAARSAAARAEHARAKRSEYAEAARAERREVATAALQERAGADLASALECDAEGQPYSHAANVGLAVAHYVKHAVARDASTGRVQILEPVRLVVGPTEVALDCGVWTDLHTTRLHAAVCVLGLKRPSRSDVDHAVVSVAAERSYWPVRDFLESLPVWDGVDRSLCTYFGVESTTYARWVCGAWLRSCVARGMVAGCQVDHVLVLEGPQGNSKSSALRTLAGDQWFGGFTANVKDDKKVGEQLQGKWIVEIAELDKWTRSHSEADLKDVLTRREDDYRGAYAHHSEQRKRVAVAAASTNRAQYLTDDTGNRRYWPIVTAEFGIAGLARDREQIWAQALAEYRSWQAGSLEGAWWPHSAELKALVRAEQAKRLLGDAWERAVSRWVKDQTKPFRAEDAARGAIGLELEKLDARNIARIDRCLLAAACVRTETKRGALIWRRASEG